MISYFKKDRSRFEIDFKDSLSSLSFKPDFSIINDYKKGERLILTEIPIKTAVLFDLQHIDNNKQSLEKTSDYVFFAKYDCQKTVLTYTLTKDNTIGQSIIYVNNNFSVNRPNGSIDSSLYYNLPLSIESATKDKGNNIYRAINMLENTVNDNLFNTANYEGYAFIDARPKQRSSANENTKIESIDNDKYGKFSISELQTQKKAAAAIEDFDKAAEIKEVIDKRKTMETIDGKYGKLFLSELHQQINVAISNNDFITAFELNEEIAKRSK